ncbi:MAG: hypothetical protein KDA80_24600, partial [Planctomycetaceae bacterium]|nr:hypothetical protein [Planctomycetaceae bacterium]
MPLRRRSLISRLQKSASATSSGIPGSALRPTWWRRFAACTIPRLSAQRPRLRRERRQGAAAVRIDLLEERVMLAASVSKIAAPVSDVIGNLNDAPPADLTDGKSAIVSISSINQSVADALAPVTAAISTIDSKTVISDKASLEMALDKALPVGVDAAVDLDGTGKYTVTLSGNAFDNVVFSLDLGDGATLADGARGALTSSNEVVSLTYDWELTTNFTIDNSDNLI